MKTVYTSVMLPLFLGAFEEIFPILPDDEQPGVGCAVLYSGSQCGTEYII